MNIAKQILAKMEKIEAERINIGIYNSLLSLKDLRHHLSDLSEETIKNHLIQLRTQQEILEIEGKYRTRIAETVRVLFLLRQRFWEQKSIQEAPSLIEDIRVVFRPRKRPRRDQEQLIDVIPNSIAANVKQKFLEKIPFSTCSGFQARSIREIIDAVDENNCYDKSFLVAGDTGAGKTEAFLFPILLSILNEPLRIQAQEGVRAILIYPRIRLAHNQLRRLIRITRDLSAVLNRKLTIGVQNGSIPVNQSRMWKNKQISFIGGCLNDSCNGNYLVSSSSYSEIDSGTPILKCSKCGDEINNLFVTKESLGKKAPDFLIITDVSLNQWLSNPKYSHLFGLWGEKNYLPPNFMVLDEVHLYERIKGAHISRLIKRFKARVALAYKHRPDLTRKIPLLIGVSATLNDEEAFLRKILGADDKISPEQLCIVKPKESELDLMEGRERYIFLLPKQHSPTPTKPEFFVTDQTASIQAVMALMHNLKPKKEWKGVVFFDSINDLMQFSRNYDPSNGEGGSSVERSANYKELWKIRTNRRTSNVQYSRVGNGCNLCSGSGGMTTSRCKHFHVGDYWEFAHSGWNLPLNVSAPVHATQSKSMSESDLILSSSSLEVGYDDADVQLVYQHKAPPSASSFIQRRGRAGRDPNDSPVISTLLWPYRNNDLFYFYHPEVLYDPKFDDIPLNPSNFNVQRSQAIQAFFDIVAAFKRAEPSANLRDYTAIGGEWLSPDSSKKVPRISHSDPYQVLSFSDGRKEVWLRETHEKVRLIGNRVEVMGSQGLYRDCFFEPLKHEWNYIKQKLSDINVYLVENHLIEEVFASHSMNPLREKGGVLPDLVQKFGRKAYHLKTYNWIESYFQVDWMLQGAWTSSSIMIDTSLDIDDNEKKQHSLDFGLMEFLPGNVSHRLRQEGQTFWTPIVQNEESTFLLDEKKLDDIKIFDLGIGEGSLLAIPNFLREISPKLQCLDINSIQVRLFSDVNTKQDSWYYVPLEEGNGYVEKTGYPSGDARKISDRSSAIAQTVIIPFVAKNGGAIL